ncbi:hypothetical protein QYM36_015491 [Artemia franciscana]|uniref:SNRNP25 ubiquitin-like domain-containing protein n=1 Tax=Artemia franciscana TaxID=6661 RepID=A0AA88HLC7_ARTSF|nr:hypothetical protein QYM36_015491 [Artemia franciscana]
MMNEHLVSEMSHNEAMVLFQSGLQDLIKNDPNLDHLPQDVTLEELKCQLSFEYGQSMKINARRFDGELFEVIVQKNGNVWNLKKAIEIAWRDKLRRTGLKRKISWRYIWKTYWLSFEKTKLRIDESLLSDYGLYNKCEVSFVRRLREQGEKHN